MRIALFYHSVLSDWNHGNAHFLRGIASELVRRGHQVCVYEPAGAWSLRNLVHDHGTQSLREWRALYPELRVHRYGPELDLDRALDGAELVIVHEWNEQALVARVGAHRARLRSYTLLFHDTHHRAVTSPQEMQRYDLRDYDGVLAFGRVIRDLYLERSWTQTAWTWHEAADTHVFAPHRSTPRADLVWVGNWGDDERTEELSEFLFEPVRGLGLHGTVHGVRYPPAGRAAVERAGLHYRGWLPNYRVPQAFARHGVTVHVPRRPYVEALRGIPTIRPFEAMACGIPLVCSPWEDCEGLFSPGRDYLVARNGRQMRSHLRAVLNEPQLSQALSETGRRTILARHTCSHRVDELLSIQQMLCGRSRSPITDTARARTGEQA
jgi:spore maturation protein CgeB